MAIRPILSRPATAAPHTLMRFLGPSILALFLLNGRSRGILGQNCPTREADSGGKAQECSAQKSA